MKRNRCILNTALNCKVDITGCTSVAHNEVDIKDKLFTVKCLLDEDIASESAPQPLKTKTPAFFYCKLISGMLLIHFLCFLYVRLCELSVVGMKPPT